MFFHAGLLLGRQVEGCGVSEGARMSGSEGSRRRKRWGMHIAME